MKELADTAWAFAKLGCEDRTLMDAIASEAIRKISEVTTQCIAHLAFAFATLGIQNGPLLDALSSAAINKLNEFLPEEIESLSWAFDTLGMVDTPFMKAISASSRRPSGIKPEPVATEAVPQISQSEPTMFCNREEPQIQRDAIEIDD